VFILGYPRNDVGNLDMEAVSFLSHRDSKIMAHPFGREHER
jgi:hypothetical protein